MFRTFVQGDGIMPKVELQVEEGDRKTYEVSVREVAKGGGNSGCLIVIVAGGLLALATAAMAMF
jgi:hypothetical protein